MKLCSKCGTLIMPKKIDGVAILKCSSCGNIEEGDGKISQKNEKTQKEIEVVDPNAFSTDAVCKEDCPKCGNDEAFYNIQQTRSADEPPTKFMRCKKCGHTWRDYS